MQIDLEYDSSTSSAPAGFTSALAIAASDLDALIANPITVTIDVGWNEIEGSRLSQGDLAEGGPAAGINVSYSQLVGALSQASGNIQVIAQELADLPTDAAQRIGNDAYLSNAQALALGLKPSNTGVEGYVGFGSAFSYNFGTGAVSGEYSLVNIAEHEITHALGRIDGDGALELAQYTAPGVLSSANGDYFSLNGGATDLAKYALADQDPADWAGNDLTGDSFNYQAEQGSSPNLAPVDLSELQALGFDVGTQFTTTNTAANATSLVNGSAYSGPVAGLLTELNLAGTAAFSVTSHVPDVFILTGSGEDAINVAGGGGNNVLDGGTGSNFLVGGSGDDTFFADDRDQSASMWSTIAGFHAGDSVTIWGLTPSDFTLTWLNNQGAAGYTGLTLQATGSGNPVVDVTLSGYSATDLASGALTVSYGTSPNEPNLPGSPYMQITAA